MSSQPTEREQWPQRRWVFWLAVVFLLQLALIFGLSEHGPLLVRPSAAGPRLALAANASTELLSLYDPTLFALPHPQSFAGPAWLRVTNQVFQSLDWSEPTNWLELSSAGLGAGLHLSLATNHPGIVEAPGMPDPQLAQPEVRPTLTFAQESRLRIEGDLVHRPLQRQVELRSWPPRTNSASEMDLLTNTIVQLVVDEEGKPISMTLLSRSGSPEADEEALRQTRQARFEPLKVSRPVGLTDALANLNWGRLVFEWHTSPLPNR